MDKKTFYVTTTLPYVNADPHIGFALEAVQADILARYHALKGDDVFFNTGTDEHGLKIYRKAKEAGIVPQAYVDEYAAKFRELTKTLNLWEGINFIRTTDRHHKEAAQEFWRRCKEAGDIYLENYKIKYCVGCELEKTDSELDTRGCCPLHPDQELEIIDEENYFFRFSKYKDKLIGFYDTHPDFVVPQSRFNEIKKVVGRGLEDFSISRLKEKMPWGVPVPDDENHTMYVWFDALVNYISAIGWPDDPEKFEKWWPVVQFAGKDNLRQQAAMWQAMLMSAGIEPSRQIIIHGFITSGGAKMSKSLGNVINPFDIVNEYGTDALRYYLARHVHPFEDSDFTMEKFREVYNADLANGLGNLVSRIMKLAETHLDLPVTHQIKIVQPQCTKALENYNVKKAIDILWFDLAFVDKWIQDKKPFLLIKKDEKGAIRIIEELVARLRDVAEKLEPFMPKTSEKILDCIIENKKPKQPLFPRK